MVDLLRYRYNFTMVSAIVFIKIFVRYSKSALFLGGHVPVGLVGSRSKSKIKSNNLTSLTLTLFSIRYNYLMSAALVRVFQAQDIRYIYSVFLGWRKPGDILHPELCCIRSQRERCQFPLLGQSIYPYSAFF